MFKFYMNYFYEITISNNYKDYQPDGEAGFVVPPSTIGGQAQ